MTLFEVIAEAIHDLREACCEALHRIGAKSRLALGALIEMLTGRSCETCDHYAKGSCWHPDFDTRDDCMTSLRPIGYKKRELPVEPVELTPEQEHQLRKIKDVLQEAEGTARESGLLESKALPPICIDRDKEDYFRTNCFCPECGTFLGGYRYGRAWTENGLPEEYRGPCHNCGQEIDWSGVPYPKQTEEAQA